RTRQSREKEKPRICRTPSCLLEVEFLRRPTSTPGVRSLMTALRSRKTLKCTMCLCSESRPIQTTIVRPWRRISSLLVKTRILMLRPMYPTILVRMIGYTRVHYESEPDPVWVQTKTARWIQSATELTVIPYTVPRKLCNTAGIKISFGARHLHVVGRQSGELFCEGELENRIDPIQSTWTTDGKVVHITLVKQNLVLYDAKAKGADADTHWHRLFTRDQFTERGMVDANYSDLPEHMLHARKITSGPFPKVVEHAVASKKT
ncbi:MAG: hypothetical protein SGPRY_007585, partial [Prymnesium sp.]